jgi:hypothetical protein
MEAPAPKRAARPLLLPPSRGLILQYASISSARISGNAVGLTSNSSGGDEDRRGPEAEPATHLGLDHLRLAVEPTLIAVTSPTLTPSEL